MALDQAKNFAKGTLSTGYDDNDTSFVLLTGDGDKFPDAPFNAVVYNATDYTDPSDAYHAGEAEIVRVTAKSTDTLTVTRAQENTAAINLNVGGKTYSMIAGLTARTINTALAVINSLDFDGTDVTAAMVAGTFGVTTAEIATAPGAPVATVGSAGTNLLNSGNYKWKVVFITAEGHTEAGLASNQITVDPTTQAPPSVTLPIGSSFVTSRELYRTAAGGTDYKLSNTIGNNTQTSIGDNLPDASLGALAPTTNTSANPKFLVSPDIARLGRFEDDGAIIKINSQGGEFQVGDVEFLYNGTGLFLNDASSTAQMGTSADLGALFSEVALGPGTAIVRSNGDSLPYLGLEVNGNARTAKLGDYASVGGANCVHVNDDAKTIDIFADPTTGVVTISGSQVYLLNIPTSDPSVAGALWNDSGTLKISAG